MPMQPRTRSRRQVSDIASHASSLPLRDDFNGSPNQPDVRALRRRVYVSGELHSRPLQLAERLEPTTTPCGYRWHLGTRMATNCRHALFNSLAQGDRGSLPKIRCRTRTAHIILFSQRALLLTPLRTTNP